MLEDGKPALDAVIAGAEAVEDSPEVLSVGFGSVADRIGRLTLDASVMDGETLRCGAVASLEHVRRAAAVARRVMEKTPHIVLAGDGAKWFALQEGFPLEMPHTLESVKQWFEKHPDKKKPAQGPIENPDDLAPPEIDESNHDTVTVLGYDKAGHLGGVCTTSGLAFKMTGRVGDSPLIGGGLYADDEAGAAGATGVGEEIIRIGGTFFVVEMMRQGKSPQEACELACKRVNAAAARRGVHPASVSFIALGRDGTPGAACTERAKFRYALGRAGKVELLEAKVIPADA